MLKVKAILLCTIMAVRIAFSDTLAMEEVRATPDFSELERRFPEHFAGFGATHFERAHLFRDIDAFMKPVPGLARELEVLSTELGKHGQRFAHIKQEVDETRAKPDQLSLARYLYLLARVSLFEAKPSDEELYFFVGVGFSRPYSFVKNGRFEKEGFTFEEFLDFMMKKNMRMDGRGDFSESVSKRYSDPKDLVDEEYVRKSPYFSEIYPLIAHNELGFFYLARAFAAGVHPIPIDLIGEQDELHGIHMSRWGKVSHDWAHFLADPKNINAEQFAHNLINYHTSILRMYADTLTAAQREQFCVPKMLPYFAEFAMALHNLYCESIVRILDLSLADLDPLKEEKRNDFEAFSVAACVHVHERPPNLSTRYGTRNLADLLEPNPPKLEPKALAKEDTALNEQALALPDRASMFKTSYVSGESPLTDEDIIDLVLARDLKEFLKEHPYSYSEKINPNRIVRSLCTVQRNKFYIEVKIVMIDGEDHLFRQASNYSRRLNFKHDLAFLRPAKTVLERDYGYELPEIPQPELFETTETFEEAVKRTVEALDKGWDHLLDIWRKNAIRLSELKVRAEEPSIAERFTQTYQAAYDRLQAVLAPLYEQGGQGFDLSYHLAMSLSPEAQEYSFIPKLLRPVELAQVGGLDKDNNRLG